MSSSIKQRSLWINYIKHMHDSLLDLYIFHEKTNPLRLLLMSKDRLKEIIEKRRYLPLNAHYIVQFILQISRLNQISNELCSIIEKANNMMLHSKTYEYIEEWNIRGIIDWQYTLRNIILGKPIAQKVIGYTISSPENLLLRAVCDYVIVRLKQLLDRINYIKRRISIDIPNEAQRGLYGLKFLEKTIRHGLSNLINALENSFLSRIPYQIYTTKTLEDIWELSAEVELAPWKPEWVDELLNLIYTYFTDDIIEKGLEKITDLVINNIIKKPVDLELAFKIYSFNLYEIYNLYIVLRALKGLGAELDLVAYRRLRATIGDKVIEIFYNRASEITKLPLVAIPDTMIKNKETIIIEAKFSNNPSYLSQAIFKVISYVTLFKAKIGILTFPTIRKRAPLDEEDRIIYKTVFLSNEESRKKVLTLDTHLGRQYIISLQLEPLNKYDDLNVKYMTNIFEQYIIH